MSQMKEKVLSFSKEPKDSSRIIEDQKKQRATLIEDLRIKKAIADGAVPIS
jgi:hypothetical protein